MLTQSKRKPPYCISLLKHTSPRFCCPLDMTEHNVLSSDPNCSSKTLSTSTGVNDLSDKAAPCVCSMKLTVT